jgi:hypothetical protein
MAGHALRFPETPGLFPGVSHGSVPGQVKSKGSLKKAPEVPQEGLRLSSSLRPRQVEKGRFGA